MNKITKIVLITCLFLGVSWSRILWVNEQYRYIQDAIDNSSDGDTVSVRNGTVEEPTVWPENINFLGQNILVVNRDFLGGDNNPATCIIDGQQKGSVVTFNSGETRDAILKGFTIRT